MTGLEFERYTMAELHKAGYWVHRIAPGEARQQPFDIIALRDDPSLPHAIILAYDCKVISDGSHRLATSRIEENQRSAMEFIHKKVPSAEIGFVVHCRDGVYFVPFSDVDLSKPSVPATKKWVII